MTKENLQNDLEKRNKNNFFYEGPGVLLCKQFYLLP
jgi:hypothetical protein